MMDYFPFLVKGNEYYDERYQNNNKKANSVRKYYLMSVTKDKKKPHQFYEL